MADRFRGRIIVGGEVPKAKVKQIFVAASGVEIKPALDDILAGSMPYLEMEDLELAMGEFDDLEDFLERERIPFVRYSDGYADYRPERVVFRPDQGYDNAFSEQVTEDGFLDGVTVQEVRDIRKALDEGNTGQVKAMLDELLPLEMPELPRFTVT